MSKVICRFLILLPMLKWLNQLSWGKSPNTGTSTAAEAPTAQGSISKTEAATKAAYLQHRQQMQDPNNNAVSSAEVARRNSEEAAKKEHLQNLQALESKKKKQLQAYRVEWGTDSVAGGYPIAGGGFTRAMRFNQVLDTFLVVLVAMELQLAWPRPIMFDDFNYNTHGVKKDASEERKLFAYS